jgi:hypothetical protein
MPWRPRPILSDWTASGWPSCAQPAGRWMVEFMSIAEERCHRLDWVSVHCTVEQTLTRSSKQCRIFTNLYGSRATFDYRVRPQTGVLRPLPKTNGRKQISSVLEASSSLARGDSLDFWVCLVFLRNISLAGLARRSTSKVPTACGRFYASVRASNPAGIKRLPHKSRRDHSTYSVLSILSFRRVFGGTPLNT